MLNTDRTLGKQPCCLRCALYPNLAASDISQLLGKGGGVSFTHYSTGFRWLLVEGRWWGGGRGVGGHLYCSVQYTSEVNTRSSVSALK